MTNSPAGIRCQACGSPSIRKSEITYGGKQRSGGDNPQLHHLPRLQFPFYARRFEREFDAIVARECIENFTDLEFDFTTLFSKLSKNGIAIFSTNINDGSDISKHGHPFIVGHTSYYSKQALQKIAKRIDGSLEVDFRAPLACLGQLGSKKRHVTMHPDPAIRDAVSEYFPSHLMADFEPIVHPSLLFQTQRFLRRKIRRILAKNPAPPGSN